MREYLNRVEIRAACWETIFSFGLYCIRTRLSQYLVHLFLIGHSSWSSAKRVIDPEKRIYTFVVDIVLPPPSPSKMIASASWE